MRWSGRAVVQKNWPAVEMNSTIGATHLELIIAWLKIVTTAPPPFDTAVSVLDCEQEGSSSRIQPPMAE